MNWTDFRRRELPFLEEACYLDYALRGLVSQRALRAAEEALQAAARGRAARVRQGADLAALRAALLRIAGVEVGEVCLTANTTTAIALLAGSVPWRRGQRILLHEDSVPSNRLPWEAVARQFELKIVDLPSREGRLELEDLEGACRGPVAWASFASVSLRTGDSRPCEEVRSLVSGAGGRLCLDVAQSFGCQEPPLADALVGSGRKWLCGPPEVGFLVMTDEAARDLIPLSAGGCSGAGARALEGGVPPVVPAQGLLASLSLMSEVGWDVIYRDVRERVGWVLAAGRSAGWSTRFPLGEARQGPLIHFALPEGGPADLEARLEARGIFVRVLPGQGSLRVSPHAWTSRLEVERLFTALNEILS